ncbi:MAG: tripartite tricarboxylate transporter permease, partial [Armatimonadetes bacterium]|nr:tripartite tricarboxylate transporter permease [Armatimonadota bacterium]
GAMVKGLIAGGLGMLFGLHGFNEVVGGARFTFGIPQMRDGLRLIPVLIGLYAVAEAIVALSTREKIAKAELLVKGGIWEGIKSVFIHWGVFLRSCVIGTVIGIIPGIGGSVANFLAYAQAVQTSKDPETFGTGNVKGVIAPEAANDAKDGGALIPTLALGIPGSAFTAILLGAFLIHGIQPGRSMLEDRLSLTWVIIFSLAISNVLTSVIGVIFGNLLVKITLVPVAFIVPVTLAFSIVGAFADQGTFFGIGVAVVFGLVGYAMRRLGYPTAPMIIGLILAPIAEVAFHQAVQLSRGSYAIFYNRPITVTILLFGLLSLLHPLWRARRRQGMVETAAAGVAGGR